MKGQSVDWIINQLKPQNRQNVGTIFIKDLEYGKLLKDSNLETEVLNLNFLIDEKLLAYILKYVDAFGISDDMTDRSNFREIFLLWLQAMVKISSAGECTTEINTIDYHSETGKCIIHELIDPLEPINN